MSVLNQKLLIKINFFGIGTSGNKVEMRLLPAAPNTGIILKRSDLSKNNIIYPSVYNVSNASYCTNLTNEFGVSVSNNRTFNGSFVWIGYRQHNSRCKFRGTTNYGWICKNFCGRNRKSWF